ncbi:MAG TPA: hypothetical protein VLH19_05205 [Patescibacteria group bacterium]|nr:hypothetical protein [Patescibacteria group bacterium]
MIEKTVFTPKEVLVLYDAALVICGPRDINESLQKLQTEQVTLILKLIVFLAEEENDDIEVSDPKNFYFIINAWGRYLTDLLRT